MEKVINPIDCELEETQRRALLLGVISRAITTCASSKKQRKDLQRNMDDLTINPLKTLVGEDLENLTES